uniref:Sugar phosphate exchanger 2 n=1 Tax=Cacopsylla melanoneura TaxID=428564 RepID=A0A8D8RLU4_9HEMI
MARSSNSDGALVWKGKESFVLSSSGVIFGIWNSHTSVGNIMGAVIASHYLESDWSLSFRVPGIIIAVSGVVILLFLPEYPSDVGCTTVKRPNNIKCAPQQRDKEMIRSEGSPILSNPESQEKPAIGFVGALKIPGVLEFSFCLFFAKLVNYTFLYWLPGYIKYSTSLDATMSGDLATVFDVGGIFGGIAAGMISDMTGKSASVCAVMLILSIPMLFIYELLGASSLSMSILLLLLVGALVNGPYALITTAVSAELGTHECLDGNSKALATVTSIIDGTGSIGAAVGPLLAGFVSSYEWVYVFYMLMFSCSLAVLLLVRLLMNEFKQITKRPVDPPRTL